MSYKLDLVAEAMKNAPNALHHFVAEQLHSLIAENPAASTDDLNEWIHQTVWDCETVIYCYRAREAYLSLDSLEFEEAEYEAFSEYEPQDIHDAMCKTVGLYMQNVARVLIGELGVEEDRRNPLLYRGFMDPGLAAWLRSE